MAPHFQHTHSPLPFFTYSIWPIFKLIYISVTTTILHTNHVSVKRVVVTVSFYREY